jgi:transcriptional regulator with XRE-family HTH domain
MRVFDRATFADNLKYYVQLSGYSVRQLADLIQRPSSTVQGYLNGVTAPDPINLVNLAKTLGVTPTMLTSPRLPEVPDGFLE